MLDFTHRFDLLDTVTAKGKIFALTPTAYTYCVHGGALKETTLGDSVGVQWLVQKLRSSKMKSFIFIVNNMRHELQFKMLKKNI